MISTFLSILLSGLLPFADSTSNRVWMESSVRSGDFRNVYDGAVVSVNRMGASASGEYGRMLLSGRFEYGYDYETEVSWRGWMNPYETSFMVCDSIPGNVSKEIYDMRGTVGVRAGRWILGADVLYRNALMAKHRDLRNKNTRMDASFAPVMYYQGRHFGFAASAGYRRSTEQAEYIQVDESTEKYLFDVSGLWLYTGAGFSSSDQKRLKLSDGCFADISVHYKGKSLCAGSEVHVERRSSQQSETGYNNLLFGNTQGFDFNYALHAEYMAHRLEAGFAFGQMAGSRPLQRQELDPDSKIRRWFTYGEASDIYWRQVFRGSLNYRYSARKWKLRAGMDYSSATHSYKEYPLLFTQSLSFARPVLEFNMNFAVSRTSGVGISPSIAWKHVLDGEQFRQELLDPSLTPAAVEILAGPLLEEYGYWSADALSCALSVHAWKNLSRGRIFTLDAGVGVDCALPGNSRTAISLKIGYQL